MAGFAAGLKALTDRSRSDCVHEQVAKLGPVSRAAGMDCECPLYRRATGMDCEYPLYCQEEKTDESSSMAWI